MTLAQISEAFAENMWVLVPLAVFAFLTVGAIGETVGKIMETRAREESRREIAAYVAEGTMTPEDAERLLAAGGKSWWKRRGDSKRC